jgi:hypothetical protein
VYVAWFLHHSAKLNNNFIFVFIVLFWVFLHKIRIKNLLGEMRAFQDIYMVIIAMRNNSNESEKKKCLKTRDNERFDFGLERFESAKMMQIRKRFSAKVNKPKGSR